MSVRKMRTSWWVDFRYEDIRYRKRSPVNTREGALNYESTLRSKLARGVFLDPQNSREGPVTFESFASEWFKSYVVTNNKPSEQESKESILRLHLSPWFGGQEIHRIGSQQVEAYKASKLKHGLSAKSVNNHLAVLKKCLRTALEWGRLDALPYIGLLKTRSERLDYLSEEECSRLLSVDIDPLWHAMILLTLHTGMRRGELLGLRWDQIDFPNHVIGVSSSIVRGIETTPKNHRCRYAPMSDEVERALQGLGRRSEFVFSPDARRPLNPWVANAVLCRACQNAGVRVIGWHRLRHTFASRLAIRDVPLYSIQKLMGHSTIAMTERYAHLSPGYLHDAISVFNGDSVERLGNGRSTGALEVNSPQAIATENCAL